MDSMQPILPSKRLQLYGLDRNRYEQTKTKNQSSRLIKCIEILDEKIFYKDETVEKGRRWLKGKYPSLGTIYWGLSGWATVQEFQRKRPFKAILEEPEQNDLI